MALSARPTRRNTLPLNLLGLEDRTVPTVALPDWTVGKYPYGWLGGEGQSRVQSPTTHFLTNSEGYLTAPQAGGRDALAQQNLREWSSFFGLPQSDITAERVTITNSYADQDSLALQHVYLRQTIGGLPVLNSSVGAHFTADGRLSALSGGLFAGLPTTATITPVVSAAAAVVEAGFQHGYDTLQAVPTVVTPATGADQLTVLSDPEISDLPIKAKLAYVFSSAAGEARPVWHLDIRTPDGQNWFEAGVDVQTGEVLFSANWQSNFISRSQQAALNAAGTSGQGYTGGSSNWGGGAEGGGAEAVTDKNGTYLVLARPGESPIDRVSGVRTVEVNPYDPVQSPFGWHDTDGKAGGEYTDTRGNNVSAQLDLTNANPTINTPTSGDNRPDGGTFRTFINPYDTSQQPTTTPQQLALTTNLFYTNNQLHDFTAAYGFTEAAGNFQFLNYSGAGLGKDQVNADAQDGSGTNNANFGTPPDGTSGRMQMYRFTITNPGTDSDLENGIIAHEFGHGVSNRLVGGASNVAALQNFQSNGMGEGWSDFLSLMTTIRATDNKNDRRPMGPWVLGQNPATGPGVREFPYSYSTVVSPYTWNNFSPQGNQYYVGERWASTLWDLNWLLIAKYGFDSDFTTGYRNPTDADWTPAKSAGNKLVYRLVLDAMKIVPANPTVIQSRDAIIQADINLTGGANRREIWSAFARRGLGANASTPDSNSQTLTSDATLPAAASKPAVIEVSPGLVSTTGGSVSFTFSEAMNPASFSKSADILSFTGPGGTDLSGAITAVNWSPDNTILTITFTSPVLNGGQGQYALTLGPNIDSADGNVGLDQNFDGTSDASDKFTGRFGVQSAPMMVAKFSQQDGAVVAADLPFLEVTFSNPVQAATVTAADLQVSQGESAVTGAELQADGVTVRFTLGGLATGGDVYFQVKEAAVTDIYGFANQTARLRLRVPASTVVTDLTNLAPLAPLGSLSYHTPTATSGFLGSDLDLSVFNLTAEAGQTLNALVSAGAGLTPRVTVLAPDGTTLATQVGGAPGQAVNLYSLPLATSGKYSVQVVAASGTFGLFSFRAQLNTRPELESIGGSSNNSIGTAQPLSGLRSIGNGGVTTVTGVADLAGDNYSVSLGAGATVSAGLQQTSGGTTASFFVLDSKGTILATSTPAAGGVAAYSAVGRFTAPTAGTYIVRVTDVAANPYNLVVATNSVLDAEPNNSAATATTVGPARQALGGFPVAGDVDYYSFDTSVGYLIRLNTATPGDAVGEPANGLGKLTLTVTGPDGSQVAVASGNLADGRNAGLGFSAPLTGTYTVRVEGPATGTDATGVYLLDVFNRVNTPPTNVSAGGPYTANEGQGVTFAATAADPEGDPITYTWDINGDGKYGDAAGPTPTLSWAELETLGIDGRTAPFNVRVQAADDGKVPVTSPATTLTVTNVPPSAPPQAGTATEGQTATFTVVGAFDLSAIDTAAGFKYAFDIGDDGTLDAGDKTYAGGVGASLTIDAKYFPDGGAGQTVKVRVYIIDKDDGVSDSLSDVAVLNAPPTGFPTNSGDVVEGQPAVVELTNVFDPSPADTLAGFVYSFDFDDDGIFDETNKIGSATVPAQYTADGPARDASGNPILRAVRIRVTDKDGSSTVYRTSFSVENNPPTATFFSPAAVTEGSSGTVTFTGPADVTADVAAGFRYAFSFDGDDTFEVGGTSYAAGVTAATATVPANLLPDGPGVLTVRGRIYDKDGGYTDYFAPVQVLNAPPTATIGNGGAVVEGSAGEVSFTAAADPSQADANAGFRYAFDFDNDNTFDVGGSGTDYATALTTATVTVPSKYLADGPTTRTVRGRVIDKDGGFTDYTTIISISNAVPSATAVFGPAVTVGTASTVSVSNQSDPSAVDLASLTYAFNFDLLGTGTYRQNGSNPSASFVYDKPGTYTVGVRVSDKDGGVFETKGTLVVSNAVPTARFESAGAVQEGQLATVRFRDVKHPSSATVAAGFRYAFDTDNDGKFDLGDGTYAGSVGNTDLTLPPQITANGGTVTVRGRVIEVNGAFSDYTTTVTVTNVAPTATPVVPTPPAGGYLPGQAVTLGLGQAADPSAVDRAALTYSFDFQGDGTFEVRDSKTPSASFAYTAPGAYTAVLRVSDPKGGFTDYRVPVTVGTPPPVLPPLTPKYYAVGSDAGSGIARLFTDAGVEAYSGTPFGEDFTGGVRVAVGDYTGDGVPDLIAGTGPGSVTRVVVIDGATRAVVLDVQPFETAFTGGVYVAAGDVDKDGKAEVVVTPDEGGGPVVAVYANGRGEIARFFGIDDANFRGGARPTVGDFDGDGAADLVVAAGFGGGPRVAGYVGRTLAGSRPTKLFNDFFALEQTLRNGVFVAAGDLNGDGAAELVVGGGPGGGPRVLAFDGRGLVANRQTTVADFFAGDTADRNGVRVSVADLDLDREPDILAGTGRAGADGFRVRGFKASDVTKGQSPERFVLDPFPGTLGGVFVG